MNDAVQRLIKKHVRLAVNDHIHEEVCQVAEAYAKAEKERADRAEKLAGILGLKLDTANRTAEELRNKLLVAVASQEGEHTK